jgi:predicted transcriptional regulator
LIRHYLDLMPTVKDLMTKNVVTIDANKTVFEAAVLMSEKDIGDLIVMEEYSRWYCY